MIPLIPVKKIMTKNPLTIPHYTSVKSAATLMKQYKISSLIVKNDGNYVGILTEVDIVKKVLANELDPNIVTVESMMSFPIATIDENDSITMANETMSWYHIRHLLVTSEGKPVGIISARDLLDPVFEEEGETVPFWPDHALKEIIAVFIVIGLLSTLIMFSPAPMEPKADPFTTPEHIKPEWYFLASYQILKSAESLRFLGTWAPKTIGIMGQTIFILLLFSFPFIDKNKKRRFTDRPIAIIFGVIAILGFILLTWLGHIS